MALASQQHAARVLPYLFIVIAAYAGASAFASWVHGRLDLRAPQRVALEPVSSGRGADSSARTGAPDHQIIFVRNLFGSETGEAPVPGAASETAGSGLSISLRGTADIDGKGFGVFVNTETGEQEIFATGEKIFDGPELVTVFARSAVILRNGRHVTLEIEEGEATSPAAAPRKAGAGKKEAAAAAPASGIRKTGPGNFLVDRREVDHALENLNTVVTEVRAVPFLRDGKSLGFRVFAIKPGSIFEQMGLKNGDVVQSINDQTLADPAKAAGMLDLVQSASALKVDILRGNKPTTLSYRIQ